LWQLTGILYLTLPVMPKLSCPNAKDLVTYSITLRQVDNKLKIPNE